MARPYSLDLRERVVAAVARDGQTRHAAARRFGIAVSTAVRWLQRQRDTSSVAPGQMGGHKPRKIAGAHRAWLVEPAAPAILPSAVWSVSWRNAALRWITDRSGRSSIPRGSALKKTVVAREQDRPDIAQRRKFWRIYQRWLDPRRLVFIDETWTKTNMAPLRGWAPRGARLRAKVPYGHWNTMTFVAALRSDRIDAPWLLDRAINGECFLVYIEKVLVPALRPGGIVIMDNLQSHKRSAVRELLHKAGARLLFLPQYSPDLNPIEQVFAKLKHLLRKAVARTQEAVCAAIGSLFDAFTAEECAHYLRNSGYGAT